MADIRRFAKWKRTAEEWFQRDLEMFENLIDTVRTNMVSLGWTMPGCVTVLISGKYPYAPTGKWH